MTTRSGQGSLRRRTSRGVLALALLLGGTACAGGEAPQEGSAAGTSVVRVAAGTAAGTTAGTGAPTVTTVLAISIDGLNVRVLRELGRDGAPHLHRLLRRGAGTLNARTEREQTVTLPNHTGMVTGRRIDAAHGGHGVTWNDDRTEPTTVEEAAGHPVRSVFNVVHHDGGSTALFAGKTKFSLWKRSWPGSLDRATIRTDMGSLVHAARRDLRRRDREFRFLHLAEPDVVGHRLGYLTPAYYDAVRRTDAMVGRVMRLVARTPRLRDHLAVILTADHGGTREGHADETRLANHRVPFLVRGPGVARGADLYALNPDYARPGRRRTSYGDRRQPVRNGDVANLALDLLGLPSVAGSEHDADQDLDVR